MTDQDKTRRLAPIDEENTDLAPEPKDGKVGTDGRGGYLAGQGVGGPSNNPGTETEDS